VSSTTADAAPDLGEGKQDLGPDEPVGFRAFQLKMGEFCDFRLKLFISVLPFVSQQQSNKFDCEGSCDPPLKEQSFGSCTHAVNRLDVT